MAEGLFGTSRLQKAYELFGVLHLLFVLEKQPLRESL
jgi:hypothetical protein